MKILYFLAPFLNILKRFGFIYRVIGIGLAFMFFSGNFKDLMFLSTANEAVAITIDELIEIPKEEIPRYLKLKDIAMMSDNYVVKQDEDSGRILEASYPAYSLNQLSDYDDILNRPPPAHVIINDKHFVEDSLDVFMQIDGLYDNESFDEVRDILEQSGVLVSDKAVLIVKEKVPAFSSTLIWTIITGLAGILILLSFIPAKTLGIRNENEEAPSPDQKENPENQDSNGDSSQKDDFV